jgi:predicted acetyltransferase
VRHLEADLPMSCVAAVTTSRVARKQGFAARLTAKAIAADAADGALVSALGMFEQGFYNRLGFGTGCYEHLVWFNPAALRAGAPAGAAADHDR